MIYLIDGSINEDLLYLGLIAVAFILRAFICRKAVGESYIYE
jgi:hypothetical protein